MRTFLEKSFIKNFLGKVLTKEKRGDATIVGTVLLIMMAIVAGVLVASFSQKSTKNVSDKIVEIGSSVECNDISLSLQVNDGILTIKNRGTLGVDKIVLRKFSGDTPTVDTIETFDSAEKLMPGVGYIYSDSIVGLDRIGAKPIFRNEEGDLMGCDEVVYEFE